MQFVYAHIGAVDRVLDSYDRAARTRPSELGPGLISEIWSPEYAPLRKTERFKDMMSAVVDYWRERGWAYLCRPSSLTISSATEARHLRTLSYEM